MQYKLYYWPLPFRGNFARLLLADAGAEFIEAKEQELEKIYAADAADQNFPVMAPPFLSFKTEGVFLSQMPAIMYYLGEKLSYMPKDAGMKALALKVVMDCNDVLDEITNHGGSKMWTKADWKEFRSERFVNWLRIFEETGQRCGLKSGKGYLLGTREPTIADIATCALLETLTWCLPELKEDIGGSAPDTLRLCGRIAARPGIARYLKKQRNRLGRLYCGGKIEDSIRKMLKTQR